MDQTSKTGVGETEDKALEGIAVAPPAPDAGEAGASGSGGLAGGGAAAAATGTTGDHPTTEIREGADAESHEALKQDPSDADAKLDVALDETFPSSDAPSNSRPGGGEPAPSSGYDEEAEKARKQP